MSLEAKVQKAIAAAAKSVLIAVAESLGAPERKPRKAKSNGNGEDVVVAKTARKARAPKAEKAARKKRVVKDYPKCAEEGCGKNRSPKTLPYCGAHFREHKAAAAA